MTWGEGYDWGLIIIINNNDFISIALFHVKHAQLR